MVVPVFDARKTLTKIAQDTCVLFETPHEYAVSGSAAFKYVRDCLCPSWKRIIENLPKSTGYSTPRSAVNSTVNSTLNETLSTATADAMRRQNVQALIAGILGAVILTGFIATIPETVSAINHLLAWANILLTWDVVTMDWATAKVAMKAAWSAALDADGDHAMPTLVREHLEKRGLIAPAAPVEATGDTEDTEEEVGSEEEDQELDTEIDESDHDTDEKFDDEGSVDEAPAISGPKDEVLSYFVGPSWFPFGFSLVIQSLTLFYAFSIGAERFDMPTSTGQSLAAKKDEQIAALEYEFADKDEQICALEAELETTCTSLNAKNQELQDVKAHIAQKKEEQSVHLRAAREDLDAIRTYIREYSTMFRRMRDDNQSLSSNIVSLEERVEDLNIAKDTLEMQAEDLTISNGLLMTDNEALQSMNEDLQRRNEDVERENVNWKNTMHVFQTPDNEIKHLNSQLIELEASHDRILDANTILKDNLERLHRISAQNAHRATMLDNQLRNAECRIAGLEEDVIDTNQQLETAVHEADMLRAEVSDKEKEIARAMKASRHTEVGLNTTINNLQAAASAKNTEYLEHAEARDSVMQDLRAKLQASESNAQDLLQKNSRLEERKAEQDKELAWARYTLDESARHATWEEHEKNYHAADQMMQALAENKDDLEAENRYLNATLHVWAQRSLEREREMEYLRHNIEEAARYPIWECAGFADETLGDDNEEWMFESVVQDEGGYASSETLELSEDEEEIVQDYEEVLLEDFKDEFEKVSHFSDEEASESNTEEENDDMCGGWAD